MRIKERLETKGFSPSSFAFGIGIASVLSIGGTLYMLDRFEDHANRANNGIEQAQIEIEKADQIISDLTDNDVLITPLNCDKGPTFNTVTVDMLEGQEVTILGRIIKTTPSGFILQGEAGNQEYENQLRLVTHDNKEEYKVSKSTLPPVLQTEGPRVRVSIASSCIKP